MSELCLSSTSKSTQFSSLLLSDLFLFCSFILSHPLYFSYFIFFSPYLLKLLSFLSPLFITTALLLLALLTLSPGLIYDNSSASEFSESKLGFLLSTYHAVTERLRSKTDDHENEEFHRFEDLEAYGIVFDTSMFDVRENPIEVLEENFVQALDQAPDMEGKSTLLEGFLKELDEFESSIDYNEEEKKVEAPPPPGTKAEKVEESVIKIGSEAMGNNKLSNATAKVGTDKTSNGTDNGGGEYSSNLGIYGSMRREKEWKKTLACKLFEERHNVGDGEGMDLLWETYEMDSSKAKAKAKKKKDEIEYYDDDGEEEEEGMDGQLCCLQALKFSAGKMNLGMGRPNLVKISKAIKGFGWLHHVTRGGKKRYN